MRSQSNRNTRSVRALRPGIPIAALAFAFSLAGCASDSAHLAKPSEEAGPIMLDGNVEEWPLDVACVADSEYVNMRFTVQGEPYTLQAGRSTLSVYMDTDGDADTGARLEPVPGAVLQGADLELQLSPSAVGEGAPKRGVAAFLIDKTGQKTRLEPGDARFMFAPTYASVWYEARLARQNPKIPGLAGNGTVRGMMVQYTAGGSTLGYSDLFEATMPPMLAAEHRASIPARPDGAIRVVSYNVLKNKPEKEPAEFVRMINSLAPQVVLLQEWTASSPGDIQQWFDLNVPSLGPWHVVQMEGVDAAIASRLPLTKVGQPLEVVKEDGTRRRIPFSSAFVQTPYGDVLLGSVHLKCCGTAGSTEDNLRLAEARALNAAIKALAQADRSGPAVCIVGGDLNLVGSRTPIDVLRMGLDTDGSDLSIANARVLGDRAFYTWSDDPTGFTPGRLDYLLYSDAGAREVNAFVVDTSRLSADDLGRARLKAGDSRASDHMPVVVDLIVGQ